MSTFAKVMIGVGIAAGVVAGGGLLYYAMRKDPDTVPEPDEEPEEDTGLVAVGELAPTEAAEGALPQP